MKLLVTLVLAVGSFAAHDLYSPPQQSRNEGSGYSSIGRGCGRDEVMHVDGTCVVPQVSQTVFVYDVPEKEEESSVSVPFLPPPKVEESILFVNLPKKGAGPAPIILPPPRQESVVYVLNKDDSRGGGGQKVIEVTTPPPSTPEVYYVTYNEGDNPLLPSGVDLQSALRAGAMAKVQAAAGGGVDGGDAGPTNNNIGIPPTIYRAS